MEGSQIKNWELLISSDKFFNVAIVPANAYLRTKCQLTSSISFGDMRGPCFPNKATNCVFPGKARRFLSSQYYIHDLMREVSPRSAPSNIHLNWPWWLLGKGNQLLVTQTV